MMNSRRTVWIQLAIFGLLMSGLGSTLVSAAEEKTNATGTWKWSFTTQSGPTYETTLKLKHEGANLSGVVIGRDGAETPIEAAAIKDGEIAFQVTRERNGEKFTSKYAGKISGDVIKGKIESGSGDQAHTRD